MSVVDIQLRLCRAMTPADGSVLFHLSSQTLDDTLQPSEPRKQFCVWGLSCLPWGSAGTGEDALYALFCAIAAWILFVAPVDCSVNGKAALCSFLVW